MRQRDWGSDEHRMRRLRAVIGKESSHLGHHVPLRAGTRNVVKILKGRRGSTAKTWKGALPEQRDAFGAIRVSGVKDRRRQRFGHRSSGSGSSDA